MPQISVVATLYKSAAYLPEFYARAVKSLAMIGVDYEFVFVDDGSPDNSGTVVRDLQAEDSRVKLLSLSRNFGHHKAIMAGLRAAKGSYVFLLDCDLEEPPELLVEFWSKMQAEGCDVVFGVQNLRRGKGIDRFVGGLFYKVFNHLSDLPIPENIAMCRLMNRRYVDAIGQFGERNFFLGSLFVEAGFRQVSVPFEKTSKGSTTYNFRRRVSLMVDAITSSTAKPLVYVFYLGLAMCSLTIFAGMAVLFRHLFIERLQVGWPSLILSVWFIGGLMLLSIGIVGIYLSRVFQEVKGKPVYIIKDSDNDD